MARWNGCVELLLVICVFCTYSEGGSATINKDSSQLDDVLSVVLDEIADPAQQTDFIKIHDPPLTIGQFDQIQMEYRCAVPSTVGLELIVSTSLQSELRFVLETWNCSVEPDVATRTVIVHLPNSLAYRPSNFNKQTMIVKRASLQGWVLNYSTWTRTKCRRTCYKKAVAVLHQPVLLLSPYDRPGIPLKQCFSWWLQLKLMTLKEQYRPCCPVEPEVLHLIDYPMILSGTRHGLQMLPPEYSNAELQREKRNRGTSPVFTIAVWLYIEEYCPAAALCSIIHRFTWEGYYRTPLIYINKAGFIHTQIVRSDGYPDAFLGIYKIPKHQWCRLVQNFNGNQWTITVNCENNWEKTITESFWLPDQFGVLYNDTDALMVFGGSELCQSFKGAIGDAVWYRRTIVQPHEIPRPSADHPMYLVEFASRWHKCQSYRAWFHYQIEQIKKRNSKKDRKRRCSNWFADVLHVAMTTPEYSSRQCFPPVWMSDDGRAMKKFLRKFVTSGEPSILYYISRTTYDRVEFLLRMHGLVLMKSVIRMLGQATCLGNQNATFMLSVIYNNGIGVKPDQIKARTLLWHCALEDHRLCHLALANKHTFGLDLIPRSLEHAYASYKNVADKTRDDRLTHTDGDVYTEQIRLTDEEMVNAQTTENGEVYRWLKYQAGQGVVSAQKQLGRLLYWGTQGVRRDVNAAVDYYRLGAEAGDLNAMHDYAIVLLKGHGVPKNVTLAVSLLERAAAKGNVHSMNTLGWYAMDIERNMTKAALYFEKAYKFGDPDAAHNLGHMYINAMHPNSKGLSYWVLLTEAFQYFKFGATHGQLMSSVMVALYNIRGLPNLERNADIAVDWARYVGEQNAFLGIVLSKGLVLYREGAWDTAMLYYMLAANAGIEVGNFNAAHLCEANNADVMKYIWRDCVWRYYSLATKRHPNQVSPIAWVKMGDYYWYGVHAARNTTAAAVMYANAAVAGDPHGLHSLAYLVEEGSPVPPSVWVTLGLAPSVLESNTSLVRELYRRCVDSQRFDAYVACTASLLRVGLMNTWRQHQFGIVMMGVIGVTTLIGVFVASLCYHMRQINTPTCPT